MQLHELKPTKKRASAKRVGRGGKRGKTSGRGHKGQKARAGNSTRPEMREIIKKLPKLRGRGKNVNKSIRPKPATVNVAALEKAGLDMVTPELLHKAGLVRRRDGKIPAVKILSHGDLTKKVAVSKCTVSEKAAEKINAAGGSVA